ncbi:hypothetical protein [Salininema proteolyticum]|uniref:TFIIB-like protein n=1 Tax=Salininema proteolyticum TaxID=1607685 RepID=A0ABV8TWN8_9ACTN
MSDYRACPICPAYGHEEANLWVRERVCEHCRGRLASHLAALPAQWKRLDATPIRGETERVGGTWRVSVGARLAVLDQLVPATATHLAPLVGDAGDQEGRLPAAQLLAAIVDDWQSARVLADGRREDGPLLGVTAMCAWLSDRLEWACRHHADALADQGAELRAAVGHLRALNGDLPRRSRMLPGVPCPGCDQTALYHLSGGDDVACSRCGLTGSWEDYHRWIKLLAAYMRPKFQGPEGDRYDADRDQ